MDTNEFIEKYRKIFKHRKRSFEKTNYINNYTQIIITCHEKDENGIEHGDFEKLPYFHLRGIDCPKCSHRSYSYTNEEIKEKVQKKYNGLYILREPFEYKNQQTILPLYCAKHKINFERTSKSFLSGVAICPLCGKEKNKKALKISKDEFFKRLEERNNGEYDTSLVEYCNVQDDIKLICHKKDENGKEHGLFTPSYANFVNLNVGCPKCALEKNAERNRLSLEEWIKRFKETHGDKYDLSLITKIKNCDSDIYPICHEKDEFGREHGAFKTSPKRFANGVGCGKCSGHYKIDGETWLLRCKKIHNNKYTYIKYNGLTKDAIIVCPIHGIFTQNADRHMRGCGCQKCNESKLEQKVRHILENNKIDFIPYYRPNFLKSSSNGQMSYDFYLPIYKIAIECQGKQHFGFGGWLNEKNSLKEISKRDNEKKNISLENNIKLLYFLDKEYLKYLSSDDLAFNSVEDLLNFILTQPKISNQKNEAIN